MILVGTDDTYCQVCRKHDESSCRLYIFKMWGGEGFKELKEGTPFGPETSELCSMCLLEPLWNF